MKKKRECLDYIATRRKRDIWKLTNIINQSLSIKRELQVKSVELFPPSMQGNNFFTYTIMTWEKNKENK